MPKIGLIFFNRSECYTILNFEDLLSVKFSKYYCRLIYNMNGKNSLDILSANYALRNIYVIHKEA